MTMTSKYFALIVLGVRLSQILGESIVARNLRRGRRTRFWRKARTGMMSLVRRANFRRKTVRSLNARTVRPRRRRPATGFSRVQVIGLQRFDNLFGGNRSARPRPPYI